MLVSTRKTKQKKKKSGTISLKLKSKQNSLYRPSPPGIAFQTSLNAKTENPVLQK